MYLSFLGEAFCCMNNVAERIKTFDNLAREQAKYQRERSTLSDVSKSFPTFQGRDFSGWLAQITQYNNAAIFEFGGGQKQVAAREIIAYFPKVERYVAYEAKALDPNASDILTDTRFQYIQGGIADFDTKKTGENTFDIAFAHDVATHLPHPFGLLENLHAITKYDGLVFMDGILIDARIANYVIGHWSNLGYTVAHTIRDTYSDLSRRGIVKLDLVLQKTKEKLVTPDVTET